MIGQTLLHYEITAPLGKGGMGEVFRATDTKLRREVALKFLPPELLDDPDRLQRFEREARVLAALSHPHVGGIHGLETAGGRTFLVLELIDGQDLAQVLQAGPLPVDQVLAVGRQIAEALEAAHELGIVHRDLKPANVKLTDEGHAKVLDFGLAKALATDDPDSSLTVMATRTSGRTLPGVVMGTAAYMSPEQARGGAVDKRTDIWAFGVVLFEMLAGGRVFSGETVSDILAAVLKTEPDWAALPAPTPPALVRLLRRCLERDPRRRLRDIGEARIALEAIAAGETGADETAAAPASGGGTRTVVLAAALAGVVMLAAGFLLGGRGGAAAPEAPLRRFDVGGGHQETEAFDEPQISPDGRRVAYVHGGELWVRDLDRLEPRRLESTEGAVAPFWSPDGRQLAFFAGTELWRIPVDGGRRELVCSLQGSLAGGRGGHGGHWGTDGTILFSRGNSGILGAPAVGGDAREIVAVDDSTEGDLHEPWRLPDGGILFVVHPLSATPGRLVVQHGAERTVLLDLPGHRILDPRYLDTGHILYERTGPNNNGLWAVPYAMADRALAGEPVLIVPEGAEGSVSADGQLVYANSQLGGEELLVALGTDGTVIEALTPGYTGIGGPCLSPDGRRLAFSASDGEEVDVWVQDLRRGTRSRLTNPGGDFLQAWHPGGEHVIFANMGSGRVLMRTLDNAAPPVELAGGRESAVTPDGRHLLVTRQAADSRADIDVVDLEAGGEARPLVAGPGAEDAPHMAPDGRHFLYISDETGRREAFLRDFPSGAHPVQISTEGADRALWSADGRRIFLLSDEGMSEVTVTADAGGGIELGRPRLLFVLGESGLLPDRGFEHDGRADRFLMARRATPGADSSRPRLVLVQNWTRLLQAP